MEPTSKTQARTDALHALGLTLDASAADIRAAWRDIAFHAHPDHTDGDYSGFSKAKTAYDFLRQEGLTKKDPDAPTMPRRPRLKRRLIDLEDDEIEACKDLLNPDRALAHMSDKGEMSSSCSGIAPSDHVPDAIGCFGRDLTFFVATPVCTGSNRVALPTSFLATRRNSETEILSFQSKNAGGGEVVVPDTIRERKFPGARSVKIRFEADQDMRNAYWMAN